MGNEIAAEPFLHSAPVSQNLRFAFWRIYRKVHAPKIDFRREFENDRCEGRRNLKLELESNIKAGQPAAFVFDEAVCGTSILLLIVLGGGGSLAHAMSSFRANAERCSTFEDTLRKTRHISS